MNERKLVFLRLAMLMLLVLTVSLTAYSQNEELASVSRAYVIRNANIIQAPGRKIDKGAILIRNGIIQSVGQTVNIPADAIIIEADSMYVYAGFIDGLSNIGVPKPKEENQDKKVKDPGNPPNDIAGIEPQRDVRGLLDPADKSISDMRAIGFTAAHTVPHGRMLPGQGAIILLSGSSPDEMVYKGPVSLFSQLEGAAGIYPNTVMGVMAKYRELYRQADQAKSYQRRYIQDASGMERPKSDRVLEAFYPVIDRSMPVAFKAEEVLDIQRVFALKNDLGFNLILGEVKEGWDIAGKIKASGAKVFLSLDLPEMKEEEKAEADSAKAEEKEKEITEVDLERERLEKRKEEIIRKFYTQPALFANQGIVFGFSTLEAKSKDIKGHLSKLVENGLSEDAALAALTTSPAQLLGLSATMGSIDNGKLANLVISDKPYFNKESKIKYVFVDGRKFELEDKPKKKDSGEEDVEASGTWSYTTETPQGAGSGNIVITGETDNYSGTITSSFSGDENELSNITVDGKELSFSFLINVGGDTLNIDVSVTVDGDTFEGSMTAGQHGSFPIEGERVPNK